MDWLPTFWIGIGMNPTFSSISCKLSDDIVKVVGCFKHLVVLFVIKHTDCWVEKKKKHPILHISPWLLLKNSFAADIYQLCLRYSAQFVTDAEFAKRKVNLIDKSPGFFSSFSTFQMLKKKKKLGPLPGRLICGRKKCTKGAWGEIWFQSLQKLCLQETPSSWLVQITLHFRLQPFHGAICFKAHLLGALLWLIIKSICSWRLGGKSPNLNDKIKVSPRVKVKNRNRLVVILPLRNQKT